MNSPPSFTDVRVFIEGIADRVPGGLLTVSGALAAAIAGFLVGLFVFEEDEEHAFEILLVGMLAGVVVGAGVAALLSLVVPGIGMGPAAVFGALGGIFGGILGASLVIAFAQGHFLG